MKFKFLNEKELLRLYKDGNKKAYKEFWKRYSKLIYNFPIQYFGIDTEQAGKFYSYILDYLKDGALLKLYSEDIEFKLWLSLFLKSYFYKFLSVHQLDSLTKDNDIYSSLNLSILDQIFFADNNNEPNLSLSFSIFKIKQVFNNLRISDRIILKLSLILYFSLSFDEIKFLSSNLKTNSSTLLSKINNLKNSLIETSKLKYENKSFTNFLEIIHMERKMLHLFKRQNEIQTDHNFDIKLVDDINTNIKKLKNKIQNQLDIKNYSKLIIKTPFSDIAKILHITEKKAELNLNKAKNIFFNKLTMEKNKQRILFPNPDEIYPWLRFLAIEEKIDIYNYNTTIKCPSNNELILYFEKDLARPIYLKIENHIKSCSSCISNIQFLNTFKYQSQNKIKFIEINKDITKRFKRMLDLFPFKESSIYIKSTLDGLSILKTFMTIDKSDQNISEERHNSLNFTFLLNNVQFDLFLRKSTQRINLKISGKYKNSKSFHATYILNYEDQNVKSKDAKNGTALFQNLIPGFYQLSIIHPSKKKSLQLEKINIFII